MAGKVDTFRLVFTCDSNSFSDYLKRETSALNIPECSAYNEDMSLRKPIPFFLAVLAGFILDQWSKHAVFERLALNESVPIWTDVLHLRAVYNTGGAFSLFSGHPEILAGLSLLIAGFMIWWYLKTRTTEHAITLCAYGLIISGAAGNILDRLRSPYMVRDFFDFRPDIPWIGHWAIFNVADIFICIGVGCFFISAFLKPRELPAPQPEKAQQPSA